MGSVTGYRVHLYYFNGSCNGTLRLNFPRVRYAYR
jgi:hypothetical protein